MRRADRGQRGERQSRPARVPRRRSPTRSARRAWCCASTRVASTTSGCGSPRRCADSSAARLRVEILTEGVHSGEASGVVPSSFRICRELLDRIEDSFDGRDPAVRTERRHPARPSPSGRGDCCRLPDRWTLPVRVRCRADGRRPDRATARTNVVSGAQRDGGRRHPAVESAGNVLRPHDIAASQRPPATDVRPRNGARRDRASADRRPAVRRARHVRRRPLRTRVERAGVRRLAAGRARRGVGRELRQRRRARSAKAARFRSWGCSARCSPTHSS